MTSVGGGSPAGGACAGRRRRLRPGPRVLVLLVLVVLGVRWRSTQPQQVEGVYVWRDPVVQLTDPGSAPRS